MDLSQSKRKPYVRKVQKTWWLKNVFYTQYMLREGTSIFVGAYVVTLMCGLLRLSQGADAFNAWVSALHSPMAIFFHLLALVSCLFHAKTWFSLAPKAIRVFKGEELLPEKPIIFAQWIGLAVVSVIVLLIAILA